MLQSTTRVKLLLAYREEKFTAAVATLQGLIGGQTHNLSSTDPHLPTIRRPLPRLVVGHAVLPEDYQGTTLWRRTLWGKRANASAISPYRPPSSVQQALALPARERKAAHLPSRASIPESRAVYNPPVPTPLCRSTALALWYSTR
jgi:hypothetical protein